MVGGGKIADVQEFQRAILDLDDEGCLEHGQRSLVRCYRKNLFMVQAYCLEDWKRIMEEGPWIFRGYGLMMEEFDGATPIPAKLPCSVRVWVQIHKIPPLYRREVISVEMKVVSIGRGDFLQGKGELRRD